MTFHLWRGTCSACPPVPPRQIYAADSPAVAAPHARPATPHNRLLLLSSLSDASVCFREPHFPFCLFLFLTFSKKRRCSVGCSRSPLIHSPERRWASPLRTRHDEQPGDRQPPVHRIQNVMDVLECSILWKNTCGLHRTVYRSAVNSRRAATVWLTAAPRWAETPRTRPAWRPAALFTFQGVSKETNKDGRLVKDTLLPYCFYCWSEF